MKVRTFSLRRHPDTPANAIQAVDARWLETGDGRLILRFQVNGAEALAVPEFAGRGRADDLWQATCFELFLKDREGEGYLECNFSPSERWAAYRFTAYREGRTDAPLAQGPEIASSAGEHLFILTATLDTALLEGADSAGISAVIVEKDGTKSYWALAHPPGDPDFHAPACFAATLPAASAS